MHLYKTLCIRLFLSVLFFRNKVTEQFSFEEFEQLMKRDDKESSDAIEPGVDLMETFEIFDKDKDGFLNACDLKLVGISL